MKLPKSTQGINVPSAAPVIAGMQQQQRQELQLLEGAAGVVTKVVNERNDEQQNAAYAKTTSDMHNWDMEHTGKEFYSGDEIPDGIDIKRTENVVDDKGNHVEQVRQRIPAYEVATQMRDKQLRSSINAAAADISSPSRRKQFVRQMTAKADEQQLKMAQEQATAQSNQIRTQQEQGLNDALLSRDYESAAYIANNYNGTNEERKELTERVDYFHEADAYNDSMSEENVPTMKNSVAKLESDDYKGNLNEVQRLATLNALRSKLSQLDKRKSKVLKAQDNLLDRDVGLWISGTEAGQKIDPQHTSRMVTKLQNAYERDPEKWAKKVADVKFLLPKQTELLDFQSMDAVDRAKVIAERQSKSETPEQAEYTRVLVKIDAKTQAAVNSDALTQANNTGVISLVPLDFSSPQAASSTLKARQMDVETTRQTYGTIQGYMTADEKQIFGQVVKNNTPNQNIQLMAATYETLGSDASEFWTQLGDEYGTYAVAGRAYTEGAKNTASSILNGQTVIKTNPEVVSGWKIDAVPDIEEQLAGALSSSPTERRATTDAIKSVYASMSAAEQDMSGSIDKDRLTKAIDEVTGGVIKIAGGWFEGDGSTIIAPTRGMTSEGFDSWVRDAVPDLANDVGGVNLYTGDEIQNGIRDGDLKLIQIEKGKYFVTNNGKALTLSSDKTKPFIINYGEQ